MDNRFFTQVDIPKSRWEIGLDQPVMLLGSCFAEHIGGCLQESGFKCDVNPFGILYNPISISEALRQIVARKCYGVGDGVLVQHDGWWHSLMHHGSFSARTPEECVAKINARIECAGELISKVGCLMLTWGSAYVSQWGEEGFVVGNCHKLPDRCFVRRCLRVEEIVEDYSHLIEMLREVNPQIRLLLTVSPVRHRREGMHGNQVSKSVLLLAADELVRRFPEVCGYFAAYEVMMDELRDYRFYADDMLHPSPVAVKYIWERFGECYFDDPTRRCMEEWRAICRGLEHRPTDPKGDEYKEFLIRLESRICRFQAEYPAFDVQKERMLCHTLLNK